LEKTLNPAPPLAKPFSKISTTEIGTTEKKLYIHAMDAECPSSVVSISVVDIYAKSRDRFPAG
jgi:hypothetical protein